MGRSRSADIQLPDPSVSAVHATIQFQSGGYFLTDEHALNVTKVNQQHVVSGRPKPLRNGDTIEIGVFRLEFSSGHPIATSPSEEHTAALARALLRDILKGHDEPTPVRRILVVDGIDVGAAVDLNEAPQRIVIGRSEDAELALHDADASREHVELLQQDGNVVLRDLGSKNGVMINGRLHHEKRLSDRDEIMIGTTVLVFEDRTEALLAHIESTEDQPLPKTGPEPEPAALAANSSATRTSTANVSIAPAEAMSSQPPRRFDAPESTAQTRANRAESLILVLATVVAAVGVAAMWFLLGR